MSGKYGSEDIMPSENTLAEEYSTSRVTIRKSFAILAEEGLIKPRHGKGYIVQHPSHTTFELEFSDLETGDARHYHKITIVEPDGDVAVALKDRTKYVVMTRSTIIRNGKAVTCDEKYIPYRRGEPVVEKEINYVEFPDMFAERFPPVSMWVRLEVATSAAPRDVARLLGYAEGQTLMVVRRYIYSGNAECVGYTKRWVGMDYGPIVAKSGYMVNGRL